MLPKPTRLRYRRIFTLIAALFVVPVTVSAQTGRVALQGRVSETVALSVAGSIPGNIEVLSNGSTVRLTLSGSDNEIRVPLLVRSNIGFKISAAFESQTAGLTQLSVIDVISTGALTSSQAVNGLSVTPQFDPQRSTNDSLNLSQPSLVLSGPRVSLGGTLQSSNNALQVTLLIRVQPQPGRDWLAHLTLVATPE